MLQARLWANLIGLTLEGIWYLITLGVRTAIKTLDRMRRRKS